MTTTNPQDHRAAEIGGPVIDVHHHWLPRELVDHVEDYLPPGYRAERGADGRIGIYDPDGLEGLTVTPERWCGAAVQLADMDAADIDVAVLSAACYPAWITLPAARLLNDAYADLQRKHPRRFVGLAHMPPLGDAGALEELERARRLGLRGVCITTNFQGRYPDDPAIRPLLRKAAELDMPVVVHAAGAPAENVALRPYNLYRTFGRSFDSCLVAARLLASGVLDELPGLRVVIPHLGGGFFAHVGRVAAGPRATTATASTAPGAGPLPGSVERAAISPASRTPRGLDQLLFDTAPSFTWSPLEIGWAVEGLGVARLALGSDYPVGADPRVLSAAVDHVRALPLDPADRARIAGGNAAAFLGLPDEP
ncbi:MAG TPA: amidohydrolase family protein [Chloroflexota bacterium]|jgi:predicted TIM-barrel fold metal-dependent hydrolase